MIKKILLMGVVFLAIYMIPTIGSNGIITQINGDIATIDSDGRIYQASVTEFPQARMGDEVTISIEIQANGPMKKMNDEINALIPSDQPEQKLKTIESLDISLFAKMWRSL